MAACLYLCIYNPLLGPTDDTVGQQVVYYHAKDEGDEADDGRKLRRVGLAQGIVQFARSFSRSKEPLSTVETSRARMVLLQVEGQADWWILAGVSKEAAAAGLGSIGGADLLLHMLQQAHRQYRLQHGPLDVSVRREWWDAWVADWDVSVHGNPATAIWNGLVISPAYKQPWEGYALLLEQLRKLHVVDLLVFEGSRCVYGSRGVSMSTAEDIRVWLDSFRRKGTSTWWRREEREPYAADAPIYVEREQFEQTRAVVLEVGPRLFVCLVSSSSIQATQLHAVMAAQAPPTAAEKESAQYIIHDDLQQTTISTIPPIDDEETLHLHMQILSLYRSRRQMRPQQQQREMRVKMARGGGWIVMHHAGGSQVVLFVQPPGSSALPSWSDVLKFGSGSGDRGWLDRWMR